MRLKLLLFLVALAVFKPVCAAENDSTFHCYIYNNEYKVYLDLNLYDNDVVVPGQEVFGAIPGYFGAVRDSRKWLITSAKKLDANTYILSIVNDYGSEDLEATLVYNPKQQTYILSQNKGSRLKIVVNRKWVKIPTEITLVRHVRVIDEW